MAQALRLNDHEAGKLHGARRHTPAPRATCTRFHALQEVSRTRSGASGFRVVRRCALCDSTVIVVTKGHNHRSLTKPPYPERHA